MIQDLKKEISRLKKEIGQLDEFVIGLVGVGERTGIAIAERLRRKIAGHRFDTGKGIVRVTASLGVASALQCYKQTKSINLYRLIEEADEAMYEIKKKLGKNFVASYHKVNHNKI